MRNLMAALAVALLAGCASTSSVVVGKTRPAVAVTDVKLYLRAPAKYEEIAILEASSKASFSITDQGKMDTVIERMKGEAAKLGANGVLLNSTGSRQDSAVFVPMAAGGGMIAPGAEHKSGAGLAIFVTTE